MDENMNDDDDWETAEIPIFNISEKELYQLKERKIVEDADIALSNDLFLGDHINININVNVNAKNQDQNNSNQNQIRKEKPPSIRSELLQKQKQESQIRQQKKEQQKRLQDIYGEATIDEYDELYGHIAN